MAKAGTRIEELGTLVRHGDQLLFRRELGGRWNIDELSDGNHSLGRPGRLVGTVVSDGIVAIERFTLEG